MSNIVKINFHGDELWATEQDGGIWVPVARVCEVLGLSFQGQHQKLKAAPWATIKMILTVAEDGKNRELFCLHIESLPMWLATIDASRAKVGARAKVVTFQCEAARALATHFVHQHKATAYELRVKEWLLERKTPHKLTWKQKLIRELCRLYAKPYNGGRIPQWLASPMDKIYRLVLGSDIKAELKARNPEPHQGSNHHQLIRHRELLEDELLIVYTLAKHANTAEDFWRHMSWHFRQSPLQLPLPGSVPALPPSDQVH